MIGSSDTRPFGKWFQIRWAEKLGNQECPYLIRWTFILFGRSIRIHHWLRSDDRRYFHDHSADLLSIVLKGFYCNVVPVLDNKKPDYIIGNQMYTSNKKYIRVNGLFNSFYDFFHMSNSIWFSKAKAKHFLDIPRAGAWTLLLEGKKYHKWGFYVPECDTNPKSGNTDVRKMRPLRYFKKFGIIQSKGYQ